MAETDSDFNKTWYRMQFAVSVAYQTLFESEIDKEICELLTSHAISYSRECESGDYSRAALELQSTLGYVPCDLPEEESENWIDSLEDCISLASDGDYDDEIDFDCGLFPCQNDEKKTNNNLQQILIICALCTSTGSRRGPTYTSRGSRC